MSIPVGKLMVNSLGLERWKPGEVNTGLRISGRKISLKRRRASAPVWSDEVCRGGGIV